eukprot:7330844-Alexandrium_andersonii.AAC.1
MPVQVQQMLPVRRSSWIKRCMASASRRCSAFAGANDVASIRKSFALRGVRLGMQRMFMALAIASCLGVDSLAVC